MRIFIGLSVSVALTLLCAATTTASVHNIHLHTDSTPDYVSIEDYVASVTSAWSDPEDQAIAFWRWMVRSQLQKNNTFEDNAPIWDPMQFYGSYPNANCGYVSSYLTAFADQMGGDWRHRYVELADHTVAELSWDAGATWHMFDTSMVMYARRHDGEIASCADIAAASSCELSDFWGATGAEPGHLYFYHGAPAAVTNPPDPIQPGLGFPSGYRKGAENPVPFSRTLRNGADSYISGFTVQEEFTHIRHGWRNRLHLRPGQTYTRYWAALGSGSEYARLNTSGVDANDGEFALNIRSNGQWEIEPGFASADPAQGWHRLDGLVHRDSDGGFGPALRPAVGMPEAVAVAKVDGANVLTSARVYMAGERGAGDQVLLEYSRDAGSNWHAVGAAPAGSFAGWYDLPSSTVGGAAEVLIRVRMIPDTSRQDCGLDDLRIEAVTQLNRMTLPTLQRGSNRVRFAAGAPYETLTLRPTLHQVTQHHWSVSASDYQGMDSSYAPVGYSTAIAIPTLANQPGWVTWRFDSPTDIVSATFGGTFMTRFSGAGDQVRLRYSWNGVDFTTAEVFNANTAPTWDARLFAELESIPANTRTVFLQYEATSSVPSSFESTGMQDVLMMVNHEPHSAAFAPVEVTWCWTEHRTSGDVTRQHTRIVTSSEELWNINVDGYRDPTLQWVRTRLADGSSAAGYDDGVDVGSAAAWNKVDIQGNWLDDVALGRPYTVSRPAASLNPDSGGVELTNGVVIPPTDYKTSSFVQGQVAYWENDAPLTITVDLGQEQTVAAVRVTSHQPDAQFSHAGTIGVVGINNGGSTTDLGVIQHDDIWSASGDHMDWGYGRSGDFTALPAAGRLAYGYWLVLENPVQASEIRLDVLPLAGRGVGLSEIQVFSAVTVSDWPDREIILSGAVSAVDDGDVVAVRQMQKLAIWPNPANPGTHVEYQLVTDTRVVLRIMNVRGQLVRTLVDGWRPSGAQRAFWDGRDDSGRDAASGVYLAVAEWATDRSVGRIVLVR